MIPNFLKPFRSWRTLTSIYIIMLRAKFWRAPFDLTKNVIVLSSKTISKNLYENFQAGSLAKRMTPLPKLTELAIQLSPRDG